jgi:Pyruvate/2-oxoacid:ferredoxin oxidoreductase delta subunit
MIKLKETGLNEAKAPFIIFYKKQNKTKWTVNVDSLKRSGKTSIFMLLLSRKLCLICSECSAVSAEYNIRHYSSKHREKYKHCVSSLRRKEVEILKWGLESQQNISRKQSNDSFSALRESYRVARLLATESKAFSDEDS